MIIKHTKDTRTPGEQLLNMYPDQLVSEKDKQEDSWIKGTVDYFWTIAINQYSRNNRDWVKNYDLVKGILHREDFYEEPEVASFTDTLLKSDDLPKYVKHYCILSNPINTLLGELSKRPDNTYVKAFDDDSKSEELQYRTSILEKLVIDTIKQRLSATGEIDSPDELQQMTMEQASEYLTSYTSMAEKWGARMLEALKVRFNLKEKSEEAFRDLLISGRQYYHIFENNTEIGFNVEVLNPKNTWVLTTPNRKYISDPYDKASGAYAAGIIEVMELSEIVRKFTLTEEEIKHLHDFSQQNYLITTRESNLFTNKTGLDSVTYDTYDPLVVQTRQLIEADLLKDGPKDELSDFLGLTNNVSTFGTKYVVMTAYWCSKKKVGKLTYVDVNNQEQTVLVDENYKEGSHPQELDIEWTWINQWYRGLRIGPDIYYCEPLEILDYCPIIGVYYEPKNTTVKSMVDLMKPYQILFNIFMNKTYESIQKDDGKVMLHNIRQIPIPKDGDGQDALEMFEARIRETGKAYIDDSPENMKGQSAFNQYTVLDATRFQEQQAYLNIAREIKQQCWELVGITEQRLGGVTSSETATATNTALTQSYAQTEPWFVQHEYDLNKLYQAMLDAAQYIESSKPLSTVSYISNEGEQAFIQVNGNDLKLKDLMVFVTSRAEDARNFQELRSLSQAMLQNGASPYEIALLYSTKSIRQMKDTFKKLKEQMDARLDQENQLKQQQLQQQQQQFQQAQQLQIAQKQQDVQNENLNKQLDRESKEKIAVIQASGFGKVATEDVDNNGIPDVMETHNILNQQQKLQNDLSIAQQKAQTEQMNIISQQQQAQQQMNLEREKLAVKREEIKSKERVAKVNKNKFDAK